MALVLAGESARMVLALEGDDRRAAREAPRSRHDPSSFQSRRGLKWLNVGAAGCALAAVFSGAFALLFAGAPGRTALAVAWPTWIFGTLWALLLRWPKTIGTSSLRWGWVASVPLAAANAAVATGLFAVLERHDAAWDKLPIGMLMGATIGAIFWIPSLLATLLGFGAPIAHAQRLARKGLAGEERGEWIVGLVCLAISLAGFVSAFLVQPQQPWDAHPNGGLYTIAFSVLGMLGGSASAALALTREKRRRAFLADAEAGKVKGYRVDPTEEGKVLVRIVSQGEGYRVADFEEALYELDAAGEATRPKHVALTQDG